MEDSDLKNTTYEEFMKEYAPAFHNLELTKEQYYTLIEDKYTNIYFLLDFNRIAPSRKGIQKHQEDLYQFQKDNPQANLFVILGSMTSPFKELMKELAKEEKYKKAYEECLFHRGQSKSWDYSYLNEDYKKIISYNPEWIECFTSHSNPDWKELLDLY